MGGGVVEADAVTSFTHAMCLKTRSCNARCFPAVSKRLCSSVDAAMAAFKRVIKILAAKASVVNAVMQVRVGVFSSDGLEASVCPFCRCRNGCLRKCYQDTSRKGFLCERAAPTTTNVVSPLRRRNPLRRPYVALTSPLRRRKPFTSPLRRPYVDDVSATEQQPRRKRKKRTILSEPTHNPKPHSHKLHSLASRLRLLTPT